MSSPRARSPAAYNLDAVIRTAAVPGALAARDAGLKTESEPAAPAANGNLGVTHPWPIFPHPKGRDFVDFDEDLQVTTSKTASPTAMTISNC